MLRLALDGVGTPSGDGPLRRDVTFAVAYEFVKGPDEGTGIIEDIPIDTRPRRVTDRTLVSTALQEGSLDWFEVVDDPSATNYAPSRLGLRPGGGADRAAGRDLRRRAGDTNANKPGSYLVLRARPAARREDLILRAHLRRTTSRGSAWSSATSTPTTSASCCSTGPQLPHARQEGRRVREPPAARARRDRRLRARPQLPGQGDRARRPGPGTTSTSSPPSRAATRTCPVPAASAS